MAKKAAAKKTVAKKKTTKKKTSKKNEPRKLHVYYEDLQKEVAAAMRADGYDISNVDVKNIINKFFDIAFGDHLMRGEDVSLSSYIGKFHVYTRDAYPGRNPRTGEEITVAERTKIVYKMSKKLMRQLNPHLYPDDE